MKNNEITENKIATKKIMPNEQPWIYEPDVQSRDEAYTSVLEDIRRLYPEGTLTEPELHEATRNFIEFVRILLEHHENKHKNHKE